MKVKEAVDTEDTKNESESTALPLPLDFCNEVRSTSEAMKKKIKTEINIKVEVDPEKDIDNLPLDLELKDMEGQFTSEVDGYKCKYCPFITIKPKYLKRHLREKHHENCTKAQ